MEPATLSSNTCFISYHNRSVSSVKVKTGQSAITKQLRRVRLHRVRKKRTNTVLYNYDQNGYQLFSYRIMVLFKSKNAWVVVARGWLYFSKWQHSSGVIVIVYRRNMFGIVDKLLEPNINQLTMNCQCYQTITTRFKLLSQLDNEHFTSIKTSVYTLLTYPLPDPLA